jgi:hypothetical protein
MGQRRRLFDNDRHDEGAARRRLGQRLRLTQRLFFECVLSWQWHAIQALIALLLVKALVSGPVAILSHGPQAVQRGQPAAGPAEDGPFGGPRKIWPTFRARARQRAAQSRAACPTPSWRRAGCARDAGCRPSGRGRTGPGCAALAGPAARAHSLRIRETTGKPA